MPIIYQITQYISETWVYYWSTTLKNMESGALLIVQMIIFSERSSSSDINVKNDSDESNSVVRRFRNINSWFVHKV